MMKKFVCLLLVLMLAAALLPAAAADSAPLRIVAAVFPVWDWTRQIIGGAENVELSLLLDNGVDLHSFQPSAADLMAITSCDVFLFVGGELDPLAPPATMCAPLYEKAKALSSGKAKQEYVLIHSDHGFNDQRIFLAQTVANYLADLVE